MDRTLQKRYPQCRFEPSYLHAKDYQWYLDDFEATSELGPGTAPMSYRAFVIQKKIWDNPPPRPKVNTYNRFARAYGQDGFAHMSSSEHAALMKQHGDIPDEYRERERLSWLK